MITLSNTTRVAVQIVVDDDSGSVTALIVALAALVSLVVKLGGVLVGVSLLIGDFVEAVRFTNTVFIVAFKSLAWGLGIRL